jgi:hypothetical protein
METEKANVEPVTMSEVLELATWDRPRTTDELKNFIASREAAISGK